jgi:hypothetical protein
MAAASYAIVIPTIGRPSLTRLIEALDLALGSVDHLPRQVVLVEDRVGDAPALDVGDVSARLAPLLETVRGPAAGPAAARNAGWRATDAEWVAFLDDDVLPPPSWAAGLLSDLARVGPDVGGTQGRVRVPLPADRRPTDWERNVAGLEDAAWATADMAYRRVALGAVGGFDPRFPRAYREDADLALRVQAGGWRLVRGDRYVDHPVRPAGRWVSVHLQAGNADDVLMVAFHGRRWREKAEAPGGRKVRHATVTAAGAAAISAAATRRPCVAAVAAGAWLVGTTRFAWARIAPGPRSPGEVATMVATSAAIPPVATAWTVVGALRWRAELLGALRRGVSGAGLAAPLAESAGDDLGRRRGGQRPRLVRGEQRLGASRRRHPGRLAG